MKKADKQMNEETDGGSGLEKLQVGREISKEAAELLFSLMAVWCLLESAVTHLLKTETRMQKRRNVIRIVSSALFG